MSTGLKANSDGSAAIQVGGTDVITLTSGGAATFVTSPTTVQAGTAAAPSITFSGDTNTGIYSPGADTIAFTEGGVESMRLNSSGNMGLGVTPSAWSSAFGPVIQVKTGSGGGALTGSSTDNFRMFSNTFYDGAYKRIASGFATQYEQAAGTHVWYTAGTSSANSSISFTQAMTLDASGNLVVGHTVANRRLEIASVSENYQMRIGAGSTSSAFTYDIGRSTVDGLLYFYGNQSGNTGYVFGGVNGERARIDSAGVLSVGKTSETTASVGSSLSPDGLIRAVKSGSTSAASTMEVYSTGAGAYRFFVGMQGQVYATITTISSLSDVRHKENIRDLNVGLAEVIALKPRLYDWKEGKGANIKNARGFIAQEFEQVFPDLIDEWKDPAPEGEEPYKSVRQDLIPVLVKAIQEQQAMIDELKAKVAALEGA